MSPAALSLLALLAVIGASLTSRVNIGVLAMALAWSVAMFGAGWKAEALMAVFPSSLFVTLLGVTLLFGIAQKNGTLAVLAQRAVGLVGSRTALLPPGFFVIACLVSTVGPGAIAGTALIAPLAMSLGLAAGVPAFLVALMVANGANAGNLSPISAVGVIVQTQMLKAGLEGHEWTVWAANFVAHLLAALCAYLLFGGLSLRGETPSTPLATTVFTREMRMTLSVLMAWVLCVLAFKLNPGLSAFAAASLLILLGAVDDGAALGAVPWPVIVMVCGVATLIGVLEKTGGMELFTTALARFATPSTGNGAIALVTGALSTYSSTSGVVYPAFLPAVPSLVQKLGGGDPLQLALSINVGAALVDVSPLSTIGALCVGALPAGRDPRPLFRSLMGWGFAMVVAGALFCQLFIPLFAR